MNVVGTMSSIGMCFYISPMKIIGLVILTAWDLGGQLQPFLGCNPKLDNLVLGAASPSCSNGPLEQIG